MLSGDNKFSDINGSMPDGRLMRFFYRLGVFFPKLFLLNLCLLISSLGIITLPAAIGGASRVLVLIRREDDFNIVRDYWREFIREFGRYTGFGAFCALFFIVSMAALEISFQAYEGTVKFITIAFCGIVNLLISLVGLYGFSMMAETQLKFAAVLKNAVLLIFVCPREMFLLISVYLLCLFHLFTFPFCLIVVFLGSPVLIQYLVIKTTWAPIKTYVIKGDSEEETM